MQYCFTKEEEQEPYPSPQLYQVNVVGGGSRVRHITNSACGGSRSKADVVTSLQTLLLGVGV